MARTRALITETERARISGDLEDDQRRYEAISRVRSRLRDELPNDIACLEEHHPELLEELRDVVCPDQPSTPEPATESSPNTTAPGGYDEVPTEDVSVPPNDGRDPDAIRFDDLDLPGSGDTLERRREAVRAAYEFLREKGQAKTAELREHAWENSETGYASPLSMWKNCVADGLKQVAEQDDVLYPPSEGEHTWVHAGNVSTPV